MTGKRREERRVRLCDWTGTACLYWLICISPCLCAVEWSGVEWSVRACVHALGCALFVCVFIFDHRIASHHIAPHRITHNSSSSNATTITSYHITSHNISYHMHSIYEWHGTAKYYYFERNRPEPKPIALHSIFLTSCERTRTNWIELNWTQSLI